MVILSEGFRMTQFYVDALGNYIGGFDGAEPPAGAIEVPEPPAHGDDKWIDGTWMAYEPPLATAITNLILRIDADVDAIYAAVIGNRSDEYNAANTEAAAFKAAGYTGTAPASVQSWATAKGWTATQAADDILTAAAHLATLRDTIRAHRLAKKEAARTAANKAALDTVAAQWSAALASIRAAAGL
jgi:hypothetical protein